METLVEKLIPLAQEGIEFGAAMKKLRVGAYKLGKIVNGPQFILKPVWVSDPQSERRELSELTPGEMFVAQGIPGHGKGHWDYYIIEI